MPQLKFNWVDIIFITLLIRICYVGFKNGILPEFFRGLGLLSAFVISFNSYLLLSNFLATYIKWSRARLEVVSFLCIFLGVLFVFKVLAFLVIKILGASKEISLPNKIIGLGLGAGRAILAIGLIYTLFINSPIKYLSQSTRDKSFSSQYIANVAPLVYKTSINFYPWKKVETPLVKKIER